MGRRQVPLGGQGAAIRLAAKLRQTRESAGLTLRKLAEVSGYSASTLSTAENGRKVPSWDVVEAFVLACGETDIPRWRGWWEVAVDDDHVGQAEQAAQPAQLPTTPPGTMRTRTAGGLIVLAVVTSSTLTAAGFLYFGHVGVPMATGTSSVVRSSSRLPGQADPVADGSDPGRAGCNPDAVTEARTNVHFPTEELSGEVELR